jgi:hypothetical protein
MASTGVVTIRPSLSSEYGILYGWNALPATILLYIVADSQPGDAHNIAVFVISDESRNRCYNPKTIERKEPGCRRSRLRGVIAQKAFISQR